MKVENSLMAVDAGGAVRGKTGQGGNASFSDILAKAVSGEGAETAPANAGESVSGVSQALDPSLPQLWRQVDNLLTALDNYAAALGDGSKSLKDLEPLTQDLEQRADDLDQGLGGAGLSGQAQDDLTNLAVQVVTQARVEAYKFRRGDYL
mgnify:CR=1 FL=1